MKNIFLFLLLWCTVAFSQTPQFMSHRGTAYNSSGNILANADIDIKIKIKEMDYSGNTTDVFEETHNKHTNATGGYNLTIGGGTPVTGSISSVKWDKYFKFLEISIALSGSGSYVVGENQLLTVPYAFYAESTSISKAVKVVNTVNDLRTLVADENDKVYVKCHSYSWDGGGGFFTCVNKSILKDENGQTRKDDNGIIIGNDEKLNNNRWLRDIQGEINIKFYGEGIEDIPGLDLHNDEGNKIQRAIDYAYFNTRYTYATYGTVVYFPAKTYNITKTLILRSGVSLKGESLKTTVFNAVYKDDKYATSESQDDGYMIVMDEGSVIGCNISDITFSGNIVPGPDWSSAPGGKTKGCMYFEGNKGKGKDSGIWYCTFKNLAIKYFNGAGMQFIGGAKEYDSPHQCNIIENVTVTRQKDNVHSLALVGQIGQFTLINSSFTGHFWGGDTIKHAVKGINCYLGNQKSGNAGLAPNVATFLNCTFQDSEYGVYVKWSDGVTFDNCWFENLDISFSIEDYDGKPSKVNILNSGFANAASFGSYVVDGEHGSDGGDSGACIISKGSYINVHNNHITVSDLGASNAHKPFILALEGNRGVKATGNTFGDYRLANTAGLTQNISTTSSGGILEVYNNSTLLLNFPASQVTNVISIKSDCMPGETIVFKIKSGSGTVKFNNFNSGGNLWLGNAATLNATQGQTLEFIKTDSTLEGIIYQLKSVY
nr:glycosyl hydrolase family 28-related protein [uncultured Flavobacterium sp.]